MAWYVDRFTDFFSRWKKGYLYTQDKASHYGVVEDFKIEDDFGESTINLTYLGGGQAEKAIFPLKDIIYFRAVDGPVFNVSKYLSIINLQKSAEKSKDEGKKAPKKGQKEPVCVALGLEFYAPPGVAKVLKADIKEILVTRFKDYPLVFVEDQSPVELTPAISGFLSRIRSIFKRKQS